MITFLTVYVDTGYVDVRVLDFFKAKNFNFNFPENFAKFPEYISLLHRFL